MDDPSITKGFYCIAHNYACKSTASASDHRSTYNCDTLMPASLRVIANTAKARLHSKDLAFHSWQHEEKKEMIKEEQNFVNLWHKLKEKAKKDAKPNVRTKKEETSIQEQSQKLFFTELVQALGWTVKMERVFGELMKDHPELKLLSFSVIEASHQTFLKAARQLIDEAVGQPIVLRWMAKQNLRKGGDGGVPWKLPRSTETLQQRICLLKFMVDYSQFILLGQPVKNYVEAVTGENIKEHLRNCCAASETYEFPIIDVAVFCFALKSRRKSATVALSDGNVVDSVLPATLVKLCTSLIWINQMYQLLTVTHEDECLFIAETSSAMNCQGALFATMKVAEEISNEAKNATKTFPKIVEGLHPGTFVVDGYALHVGQVSDTAAAIVARLQQLLHELWNFGKRATQTAVPVITDEQILDDMNDSKVLCGNKRPRLYQFIVLPPLQENTYVGRKLDYDQYLERITTENFAQCAFVENGHWVMDQVKTWVSNADEFLQLLMVAMQLAGGSPARATDIELYSLMNTTDSGKRTMFIIPGRGLVSMLVPQKTKNMLGGQRYPIARLYPRQITLLFLQYTVLMREQHAVFSEMLYGNIAMPTAAFVGRFLVCRGFPMNARMCRTFFQTVWQQFSGIRMKMSSYRHISQHVLTNIVLPYAYTLVPSLLKHTTINNISTSILGVLFPGVAESLMKQAGHSVKTALNQYATTAASLSSMPSIIMNQFLGVSEMWFLVMCNGSKVELAKILHSLGQQHKQQMGSLSASNTTGLIPPFQSNYSGPPLTCKSLPNFMCMEEQCITTSVRTLLQAASTAKLSQIQLQALEKVLKLSTSMRSNTKRAVLAIGKTGSGKTMIFTAPVIHSVRHTGLVPAGVSVVVVPYTALVSGLEDRINASHLAMFGTKIAYTWDEVYNSAELQNSITSSSFASHSCLLYLIATPEAAAKEEFKQFFYTLLALGKLQQLVIDEVHHLIHSVSYRPSYSKLKDLVSQVTAISGSKAVVTPLLLMLSATIAEGVEEDMVLQSVGLSASTCDTIRMPVHYRPTISCAFWNVSTNADALQLFKAAIMNYRKTYSDKTRHVLIFTLYKNQTQKVRDVLVNQCAVAFGNVAQFHADMSMEEKREVETFWHSESHTNETKIVVATTSMGEGVDHENVDFVIHYQGCYSLTNYYQESGRAGRSANARAKSLVISSKEAMNKIIRPGTRADEFKEKAKRFMQFVEGNNCRILGIAQHFNRSQQKLERSSCSMDAGQSRCDICSRDDGNHWSQTFREGSTAEILRPHGEYPKKSDQHMPATQASQDDSFATPKKRVHESNSNDITPIPPQHKMKTATVLTQKLGTQQQVFAKDQDIALLHQQVISIIASQTVEHTQGTQLLRCMYCKQQGHTLTSPLPNATKCGWRKLCGSCGATDHFRSSCKHNNLSYNAPVKDGERFCYKCLLPQHGNSNPCNVMFRDVLHWFTTYSGRDFVQFKREFQTQGWIWRYKLFFEGVESLRNIK